MGISFAVAAAFYRPGNLGPAAGMPAGVMPAEVIIGAIAWIIVAAVRRVPASRVLGRLGE